MERLRKTQKISQDILCFGQDLQKIILEFYSDAMECIQKFPDWPFGARTANGTTLRQ
jgi:hypothetical protein